MKKFTVFMSVCLLALGFASCHKRGIKGEGNIVSETRIVGEFAKIEANGSTDVTVVQDEEYYVIVKGYSNLVPVYKTKVNGDRLILEYKEGYWNVRNDNITVEVHTPYADIPFPFAELPCPGFAMHYEWTAEHMAGYLNSWSAVQHYIKANGSNPVDIIKDDLRNAWGDEELHVTFPIFMRAGIITK